MFLAWRWTLSTWGIRLPRAEFVGEQDLLLKSKIGKERGTLDGQGFFWEGPGARYRVRIHFESAPKGSRLHMKDHLARVKDGAVETITQNGEAALVVMSPETYDYMVHVLHRGHIWDQAIDRINNGERGKDARQAIRELADKLDLEL